jgi:DNA-binding XRE family transcriptional regulator
MTLENNTNSILVLRIRKAKSMGKNKLKKIRESMLMSKAELARQANVSPITITRIEKNMPCRMETQRKILLALGFKPADKHKIFKD